MQHGKTFRNRTGGVLQVKLTVRQGAEPGQHKEVVEDTLQDAEEKFVAYGDDQNPFLDDIWAVFNLPGHDGGGSGNYEALPPRGSEQDTAVNTNDTVTVSRREDGYIQFDFSNG